MVSPPVGGHVGRSMYMDGLTGAALTCHLYKGHRPCAGDRLPVCLWSLNRAVLK